MKNASPELLRAVEAGEPETVRTLLAAGENPNARTEAGDPMLTVAIESARGNARAIDTMRLLIGAGANVDAPADCPPLCSAMPRRNADMLLLLLESGANANAIVDGESIYDLAEFDYRYDEYDLAMPEEPTEADRADEDAWIAMLERLAARYGKRPPVELRILRRFGGKTMQELRCGFE